ncbi:monomeric sarcosine oxidase-like isoform X3 [Panulirus ornatus]|uniref:monomeric sarcosine oxidase-like isoform X3 n=1 Tax=Panulirus ornatus TaxID=150431 RepID=UPI003A86AA22
MKRVKGSVEKEMFPEEKIYDLIVIGAGMMGSAAAYHASQLPNTSVCLVGPPEPKIRKEHEIFGSWFDEGRTCGPVNTSHTWCNLAAKSVKRFRDLENMTGINFYTESPFVHVYSDKKDLQENLEIFQQYEPKTEDITKKWKDVFPFLHLPDGAYVSWIKRNAGHLNPRQLVKAHQTAAQMLGAKILYKIVSSVLPSNCATHKSMPCIVAKVPFGNLDGAYILPPIKYPDGHWYLKLGHGRAYEERKTTLQEVREWYVQQTGNVECVKELARYLCYILPGLKVEKICGDGCLTAHTPNSEPYIDIVVDGFGVALGGNGYGAKACDEIGHLAAHLALTGEWKSEIPKEQLKIIWKRASLLSAE